MRHHRLFLLISVLLASFVLGACAPAAAPTLAPTVPAAAPLEPTAVVVEPTAAPVEPTAAAAEPTAVQPTSAPVEPTAAAAEPTAVVPLTGAGAVAFQIVPGESSAQYEVGETFFGEGNRFNLAVGQTTALTGTITVDTQNPQNSQIGPIEADISQLKSDSTRRDGAVRERFLKTNVSPLATFSPTAITGLPDTYTPGQALSFQVTGDLTVGQFGTRPVTFDVTAQVDGDTLTGTAVTNFLMSDFGFGPIEIAGILGTEDAVKLTLNLVARSS